MSPMGKLSQVGGSSMGELGGTVGPDSSFRGRSILGSQRYFELDWKGSFYECGQHDKKMFDFDGRVIPAGGVVAMAAQPLISKEVAAWYVPLKARRPSSPYRLAKVIVSAFTNMVFGEDRFPQVRVDGDADSQDYLQAIVKVTSLPVRMIRARNLGGGTGTVGLSWCFVNGRPRVQVHNAKYLYVHSWEDRESLIPRHVTEVYQYPKDEWDPERKRYARRLYWHRRDWTRSNDILFKPVLVEPGRDPAEKWEPDLDRSVVHGDGLTHFVWVQNLPSDDIDGLPDYEGLFESFDAIDLLLSVITRGATLNLDPTLVVKTDLAMANTFGLRKGSDNALVVDAQTGGDASYLELAGTSIEAGVKLFEAKRRAILEVAQCVIPDPDEVAAGGTSSVAQKVAYAPMLGKCDVLREQYGTAIQRLLEAMLAVAMSYEKNKRTVVVYDEEGKPSEEEVKLDLPARVEKTPILDEETGAPTGEHDVELKERVPGEGGDIDLEWGSYFMPTPADQQGIVTTLSTAVGGAAFMSPQTASELAMTAFGRDPGEEWTRLQQHLAGEQQKADDMFEEHAASGSDSDDAEAAARKGVTIKHEQPLHGGGKIVKEQKPQKPKPPMPPPGQFGGKGGPPGQPGQGGGFPPGQPVGEEPPGGKPGGGFPPKK